jgi:NADPH-dependent 2,4-dienoyl-CoA reductase/sulfur reductase-like enzyme
MKHVILGAGPAGVIAAETIRKHAPHDQILIVGDEDEAPYSRMAIPYLLIGKVAESGTHLRHGASHFQDLRIDLKHARCTAVNAEQRSLTLSDGSALTFDTLLIATGSRPVSPPIPGIDSPDVHPCWTLADARAIQQKATKGKRVLQMGAGFIGCIIMESLAARGVELTVVEMGDRMVPRMMGPTAGGMIKDWCEKKGVKVFTGARVTAIEPAGAAAAASTPAQAQAQAQAHAADSAPASGGLLHKIASFFGAGTPAAAAAEAAMAANEAAPAAPTKPTAAPGKGLRVKLSTGQTLHADLVISATGVKPNIEFLEKSSVKCLLGVLTDEHMRTSVPGIYSAGDCAEAFDKVSGKTIVSAIQPNAADQAYVAAMNMVGRPASLKGVTQINVLDTLGLVSTSFGNWEGVPGGQHVELTDRQAGRHLSLQFKGDVMVGCNSLGWTDHVGVMRGLVEGQVKLGEWKDQLLKDPTRLMEAYLASAQAQDQRALLKVA